MTPIPMSSARPTLGTKDCTRNRRLTNHRGFSVAFSNGLSVAFSNGISHVSGMFQRIITCPVDFNWNCRMDFQWHFRMDFHCCEFWCNILPRDPQFEISRIEIMRTGRTTAVFLLTTPECAVESLDESQIGRSSLFICRCVLCFS